MRAHSVSIVLTTLLLVAGLTIAPFATLGPAVGTATAQEGFNVTDSAEVEINEDGSFESVDLNSTDAGFPNSYAGDPGAVTVNGENPPPGLTLTAQADQPNQRVRFLVNGEVATIVTLTDGDETFQVDDTTIPARDSGNTQLVTLEADLDPRFSVSINDSASTTDVTAGEDAVINATIENTGEIEGTQTINFTVDGATEDSAEVSNLAAGSSETVEFTYTTEAADDGATAAVASDDDTATRTLTVTEPANFAVAINDGASTTDVTAGENAVINATIENTGDETATQTINFTVNGSDEGSVEVTNLNGGATETVEFSYTTALADDGATAEVASDDDNATRTLTVDEQANFAVTINDGASTTDVTAGENAVINATIENTGDETGTQTINFTVGGASQDSASVNLNGGTTETVEFTYTTETADDGATAAVASDDATATRTLTVTEPADPANFAVTINDGASTTDVTAGEDAVINATIQNTGDETGTQTIEFTVGGTSQDSIDVTDLAGGATETVEFTYTTEAADDGATATVASDDATATRTLTVTEPADPANFAVTINDGASTTDVTAGEDAVINATIENTGDETGTQTINFTVGGTSQDSIDVTDLAGGATETVEFTYTTETADDGATAAVASDDATATRTLTVTEPADPANFAVTINDQASTTDVTAGENAVINAAIENTGDEAATQTINFTVGGSNEGSVEVTNLNGGATETVEFTYATELADDGATAAVASDDDTATRTLNISEPDPANFAVSINDQASTTDVTAGENAVINATVENTGDEAATQTINFIVNGTSEGSAEVTNLAGGATETVEFTYTTKLADDGATAAVASDNDTDSSTLTVGEPANFNVTDSTEVEINEDGSFESVDLNSTDAGFPNSYAGDPGAVTVNGENPPPGLTLTAQADQPNQRVRFLVNGEVATIVTLTDGDEQFPVDDTTIPARDSSNTQLVTLEADLDPRFSVSINDSASTTDVTAGEDAVINATIENTGEIEGTQTINFTVDGATEDSAEVSNLAAGSSETVEFTYTTEAADDGATAAVASDDDTATRTLTVTEPANFAVAINDGASTTDVTAGENAVINATIENTGDETATQTINFTVNGSDEGSVEVTNLNGGATETVEFSYTTALADDGATAEVASDDDNATRTLTVDEQANFAVTINDGASTTDVTAGENAVINATIENTGDETATQTIDFTVNDTPEDNISVDLAGGATETVEFTYTTEAADDGATATVASDDDSANRTLTVTEPANFAVAINDGASTTDVTAGEDAVINATIENTGDETATQTIDFTVNDTNEDNVSVNLPGGATETVEFTYTTEAADDGATAAVASDDDSANRTLTVTEPANFAVSIDGGASTTDVTAGEDAVINATIENTGDETATQTINFTVNDTVENSTEVNLAGGATEPVEFTYTTDLADDGATATVASDNDTDRTELTVGEQANFDVTITDATSTTDVTAGEDAVINATVENTGDETATQTINFTVNGTNEDSALVTLAGGATEPVEFTSTTELADDGATAAVASNDDSANRTLSVAPTPPNFTVSINNAASTTDVIADEDAVITATIENTGDEAGIQTINFTVNDTVENSTEVNLAGGATETVEFTYTTDLADDGATAEVASDNATDSTELTVGEQANFSVSITDTTSTTDVTAGEDAVINATVENTGDETATQTIDFTVNDTNEDNVSVNLAGGATETVEFSYTTEAADDGATAAVASDDDSANRTLTVTEPANFAVIINGGASTTDVTAGEDAVINATIENTGDETATQTINFSVGDTVENSTEVNLAGGATETVEFTYATELADDNATATVASDNDTATETLSVDAPANFSVSIDDAASTTSVTAGEDAVITATIENTGDETATQTINFSVGDTVENSTEVTDLAGGATETVEFTYAAELADDNATATVASDNDTATRTLTIAPAPANFAVTINDGASTTDVTAGENAVINATIENTGDETATQTIDFSVNETVENSTEVNLAGGATETVEFTYTAELADDGATAAVASDDDTATTTLSVTEPANFAVAINDQASTTDVTAGEDAVINATVENTGDETATQTINFTVNGSDEGSVEVTNLNGGATETVAFNYTTELADDGATATVASDDASDSTQLTVTEPANFAVTINDGASTTDVTAGENAVINATIENTGDETATQTIDFTVNDTVEDNVSVNLAGGATEAVEFTYTTEAADDGATAAVASDDDSANRTLNVTEPADPANFAVAINGGASTTDVTAGENAVINATIENTGDEAATQTINFTVGGSNEGSVEVTNLAGGATETIEFSYTTEAADDGATAAVASDDDTATRTLTVTEPADPANFAVTINDGASTTDVTAGENAVINATIENTGDEAATQTINFTVNGSDEGSVDVTNLAGGTTETVEFTYTTEAADDGATAEVASDDDNATRTLTVTEPADPANFAVSINNGASTTDVTAGENAVINATVSNTGDEAATQTINFTVNGSDEGSVEVTNLAGGATEAVEFTYTTEAADDGATAEVASDDDNATRTLTVDEQANFAVSINDGASTTDVTAGEDAVINATVSNTGDEAATQTINFTVNGSDEGSAEVTDLAGGATETVEFTYTTEAADDGATAEVASDDDNATRTLTVTEPADPANFAVSINNGASTTDVTAGENAVINATIENTGDETATQTINFTVNGSDEGSVEVTNLAGGTTETVEFTYTTEAADNGAEAEVASDDDNATRTLTVTEPADPANFAVSINDQASTTDVTAGENAVINATVSNTGDETATQTINFTVNGSDEGSVSVNLNGGATETVEFTYTTEAADDGATAAVASDDDTATRTLTVTEPADPANFAVIINDGASTTDVTAGENAVINATIENTGDETATQTINFTVNGSDEGSVSVNLNGGATETVEFTYATELADDGATAEVASDDDNATTTLSVGDATQPDPEPQGSVTFNNQTVPNGTETVTVASANYTLADGTPGDYVVVAHVVGDEFEGGLSAPVGYSSNRTGEAADITVDLNASEAQGDALDTLTANTTLRAMLHETSSDSAFGPSLGLATDDATITVEEQAQPDPGTANLTGLDIAGQGDTARLTPGAERNVTVTLANTGGEQGTFAVALNITANGTTADTETQEVPLASGANTTVTFENVTGDLAADEYTVSVTAAESAVTGSLTVKAAPAAIGGDTESATAQDTDGDGTFEDVNGDGNFSVEDVFELFNNQDAVPEDDTAAFDFNNDGDFNVLDVQRLLNQQQEGS